MPLSGIPQYMLQSTGEDVESWPLDTESNGYSVAEYSLQRTIENLKSSHVHEKRNWKYKFQDHTVCWLTCTSYIVNWHLFCQHIVNGFATRYIIQLTNTVWW